MDSDERAQPFGWSQKHTVCQVCSKLVVTITRSIAGKPTYIARICDVFSKPEAFISQDSSRKYLEDSPNWADSLLGNQAASGPGAIALRDETRACMIAENGMLCYRTRGTSEKEVFTKIRWAQRLNYPYRRHTDLSAREGALPCRVAFPLCSKCTRLARNYVSHWNATNPHSKYYGYDVLYFALQRRLLSLSADPNYLQAIYVRGHDNMVNLVGNAAVVQATPASMPFNRYPVPPWAGKWPFDQAPSLPKWLLSKLKLFARPDDDTGSDDSQVTPREGILTEQEDGDGSSVTRPNGDNNADNKLCSLPNELKQLICRNLDRNAIFSLRLASKGLASSLPLDQAFWYRQLLSSDVSLFGFEPLNADAHTHIQSGEGGIFGRIDAFSELQHRFGLKGIRTFDPVSSRFVTKARNDQMHWRRYDWQKFARTLGKAEEFLDGGSCADAPASFRARRWLWGELDKIYNELMPADVWSNVDRRPEF